VEWERERATTVVGRRVLLPRVVQGRLKAALSRCSLFAVLDLRCRLGDQQYCKQDRKPSAQLIAVYQRRTKRC